MESLLVGDNEKASNILIGECDALFRHSPVGYRSILSEHCRTGTKLMGQLKGVSFLHAMEGKVRETESGERRQNPRGFQASRIYS